MPASIFASQQPAFRGGGVAPISPATLLAGGVMGAWYDTTDITTMFQDTTATAPVTTAGQLCARINAKAGTFGPLQQATVSAQPLVSQNAEGVFRLTFDSVDDTLACTAGQAMSQTDEATVFVAANFLSSTTNPVLWAHGGSTSNGSITAGRSGASLGNFNVMSRGTVPQSTGISGYTGAISRVVAGRAKIASDIVELFLDGLLAASTSADQGTGTYSARTPQIGRLFNSSLDAHISGIFVTNRYLTDAQIQGVSAFLKALV